MLSERRGGTNLIKRTEEFFKNRDNKIESMRKEISSKDLDQC